MSTSSSFPNFASFPDLNPQAGSSTRTPTPQREGKEGKRSKTAWRGDDGERDNEWKKRKHKHKHREREDGEHARRKKHSRSRSPTRERMRYELDNDERSKREEDRARRKEDLDRRTAKEGLVYFTDQKGDPLNVRYGGLHAGDVSKYWLVGGGKKVLGLSPALSVVYRGRGGLEVGPFGRRRVPALVDPSARALLAAPPKRRLLASSVDQSTFQDVDGFIRVRTKKPSRENQPFREIELAKQSLDSDESDLSEDNACLGDESDTTTLTSLQSTLKSLEEGLSTNPTDVSTWLSLLSHTLSTVPITSKNASKARADISLSVLSRAMSSHPNNSRSKTLRLKYLKAGEQVWEPDELHNEWEKAIKVDDIEIWMAWFDWRVHRTPNLLESIVEDMQRTLGSPTVRGDEIGQLRIFWRAAVALRDAGYVERATALFQAQAELLYAIPKGLLDKLFEEQLDDMEEYWDSEVPRLGEPEASGWTMWNTHRHEQHEQTSRPTKPEEAAPNSSDPYSKWAMAEAHADRTRTMSFRSAGHEEDVDPYAIVLFSDIRPFLLCLRSPRAKDIFRHIWLAFLGLHVPGFLPSLSEQPEDNLDDRWAYSHLATEPYLTTLFPPTTAARRITADAQAGVLIGRERVFGSGFGPVKNWSYNVIAPLESQGLTKWTMWATQDVQGVDLPLVKEVFRHCRLDLGGPDWDVLALAVEAAVDARSAVKMSKSLLSGAPESLPHWAAHARLEILRGRLKDAKKVYQTVLTSCQNRLGESTLWWDWAQLEWLTGDNDAALQVIIQSSRVAGLGGPAILRTKQHFGDLLTQASDLHWKEREAWIKVTALLELLTSSTQSALSIFGTHLSALKPRSPAHESLTVASLALLYNHGTVLKNPIPPVVLRARVESAIEVYPNNTAILGMFLEAEKGQGIWGRVRAVLGETTTDGMGQEKGVARRVAEVWVAGWEKGRWEAEVERTRGGLAAAVEAERTRGSAVLWKVFIAFEIRAGEPERAKKLLFRAVGECPLVKELYLLAFGPLREMFSTRELKLLADTMAERRLRMRVGLDEVVGDWTDNGDRAREEKGEPQSGDEDEIEAQARELRRRLMPY